MLYTSLRRITLTNNNAVGVVHQDQPTVANLQLERETSASGRLRLTTISARHLLLNDRHPSDRHLDMDSYLVSGHVIRLRRPETSHSPVQDPEYSLGCLVRLQHVPRHFVHDLCGEDAQNTRELQRGSIHWFHHVLDLHNLGRFLCHLFRNHCCCWH